MNMVNRANAIGAFLAVCVGLGGSASGQEQLEPGIEIRGSVAAGEMAQFPVEAPAGYLLEGVVEQLDIDLTLGVFRPDGRVTNMSSGVSTGAQRFQIETTEDGIHRIAIRPNSYSGGSFVIRLDRREPLATEPERLAAQLLAAYDRPDSPGVAVAVFQNGETLFSAAYGMANLTYGIPFTTSTRTNIESSSKQFTAFAIMLLEKQGKIDLDDDVRDHVAELPDFGEKVTVRHLLTHTSGYREIANLLRMAGRRIDIGDHIDRNEVIEVVQRQPEL